MATKGFQIANTVSVLDGRATEQKIIPVGCDNGNLHFRVVSEDLAAMDQSYVYTLVQNDELKSFNCVRDASKLGLWSGKSFITGEYALAIDGTAGDRTMDDESNKYKLSLPLLVASIWDKISERGTVIQLGVSVPNPAAVETQMIDHLNGSGFIFSRAGERKVFDIELVKVYTEGQGVIKRQSQIDKGIFLLDIGNDTIIVSEFAGYSLKNSFPLTASGVRALVQNLIASNALSAAIGRTANLNAVVDMFEKSNGKTFKLYDRDVTAIVNEQAKLWIVDCIKQAKRNMKNAFDNSPSKIATGGGCKIEIVRETLISEGFKIATDALWDNATGVFQFVYKKSTGQEVTVDLKTLLKNSKSSKTTAKAKAGV